MSQATASPSGRESSWPAMATASPTATAPIALTTPFSAVPSCSDIWSTKTIVTSSYLGNSSYTSTFSVLVSDAADPRFSACQPPRWDAAPTEDRFTFSPAVCPSDWTAYSLDISARTAVATPSVSTSNGLTTSAYCCARGFTFNYPDKAIAGALAAQGITGDACIQTIYATRPTSVVVRAHHAWQILWEASDTKSLSPVPPPRTQCYNGRLSSWVPGSTPTGTEGCDPHYNDSAYLGDPMLWFLVAGVPAIVLVLVSICCFFCCGQKTRENRQKRQYKARMRMEREKGENEQLGQNVQQAQQDGQQAQQDAQPAQKT